MKESEKIFCNKNKLTCSVWKIDKNQLYETKMNGKTAIGKWRMKQIATEVFLNKGKIKGSTTITTATASIDVFISNIFDSLYAPAFILMHQMPSEELKKKKKHRCKGKAERRSKNAAKTLK